MMKLRLSGMAGQAVRVCSAACIMIADISKRYEWRASIRTFAKILQYTKVTMQTQQQYMGCLVGGSPAVCLSSLYATVLSLVAPKYCGCW